MSLYFRKTACLLIILSSLAHIVSAHSVLNSIEKPISNPLVSSEIYLDVIKSLTDHVNGDILLTDADFVNHHEVLSQQIEVLATDMESISKSFELLELFEEKIGALFTTPNTRNGFNRQHTADGLNLHRNIILIHQGLIDYTYSQDWLQNTPSVLEGKLFQTSQYFPGFVDAPENADIVETAKIKFSYLLANGSQPWADIGNSNVVRPTGCYLAPGSIAEVTVPESLIGKGFKIRVGAHFWNLEAKSRYKRLDRVSITYDINETTTKIANPLGGGIYLEVPLGVDEGILDITLKNVVRSPFYSKKTFHETSLTEWLDVERKHPAPWTDFETDKFMMQVPTSWIYEFEDPKSLLEDWDNSMDAVSDLLGRPRITDRHKNYLQFDVVIRGSAYHPGYPMSNTPYDPNADTDGLPKHKILQGPQYDQDIHFHELGHEVAISKFVGETEALVNFLYIPVLNKYFDYSLDDAFQQSFGPSYNLTSTKDNTTRTRLVAETFLNGDPRNTCNCTKNEVRYQHRGYAHYVDIVELFGWEALEKFWKSESDAAAMGNPFPVNNQAQDDRIFRMSQAAGVDLRPLFHFWGIHPNNQDDLVQRMQDNNLALPMSIKSKLHQYKNLIPANYDEFVELGNDLYPDFLNYTGNQFDFGPGWYKLTAETYDENIALQAEKALGDIIIFYYGSDCFELEEFLTPEFSFQTAYCYNNDVNLLPLTADNGVTGYWNKESIDASESGLFDYSFLPNLEECAVEKTIMIEIYDPLDMTIDIIEPLCFGDYGTAQFNPFGGTGEGFMYSINGDSLLSGMYSVVVTDNGGCSSSLEFEVTQPTSISIEWIDGEIDVTGGTEPYTITIDSSNNLQTVTVVDDNGCQSTADFVLSSVEEEFLNSVKIFPNPASDVLYIDLLDAHTKVKYIQLVALDGKKVQLYLNDHFTLDLSQVNNGVHILQILLENGTRIHQKISIFK